MINVGLILLSLRAKDTTRRMQLKRLKT